MRVLVERRCGCEVKRRRSGWVMEDRESFRMIAAFACVKMRGHFEGREEVDDTVTRMTLGYQGVFDKRGT